MKSRNNKCLPLNVDGTCHWCKENPIAKQLKLKKQQQQEKQQRWHRQRQHLKLNNIILKLTLIVLSIVLLTGISLVPTLQIGINGQVQQQQQQQQLLPNKMKLTYIR